MTYDEWVAIGCRPHLHIFKQFDREPPSGPFSVRRIRRHRQANYVVEAPHFPYVIARCSTQEQAETISLTLRMIMARQPPGQGTRTHRYHPPSPWRGYGRDPRK